MTRTRKGAWSASLPCFGRTPCAAGARSNRYWASSRVSVDTATGSARARVVPTRCVGQHVVLPVNNLRAMFCAYLVDARSPFTRSEDDGDEFEAVQAGSALVSWFKRPGNPATVDVDSLEVVDRALLHHDVVARRSAPLGMSGYVTAVDVACEVRFCATGEVVSGVDSRLLQQVQPLRQGSYVVRGQWVGKVDEAFDHITLRMSEGSVCRIANADDDMLAPLEEQGFNDDTPYYPGLRVKANQGTLMRAKWLKGGPKSGIRERCRSQRTLDAFSEKCAEGGEACWETQEAYSAAANLEEPLPLNFLGKNVREKVTSGPPASPRDTEKVVATFQDVCRAAGKKGMARHPGTALAAAITKPQARAWAEFESLSCTIIGEKREYDDLPSLYRDLEKEKVSGLKSYNLLKDSMTHAKREARSKTPPEGRVWAGAGRCAHSIWTLSGSPKLIEFELKR